MGMLWSSEFLLFLFSVFESQIIMTRGLSYLMIFADDFTLNKD